MKKILPVFPYLFHPLFVPVYATLFYFLVSHNFFYKHEIYIAFLQVLIITILLPLSLFYLVRSFGGLKSRMADPKDLKVALAFYALLLLFLIKFSFSILVVPELYYYFVGVLISVVMALALLLFGHKASLHTMALVTFTLFAMSISAYYHIRFLNLIALLIVCTGAVASARLQAGKHSFGEVVLGGLLGVMPQVGLWYFWLLPSL